MRKISRKLAVAVTLIMLTVGFIPMVQVASEAPRGPVNNTDSEPNDVKADATIVDADGKVPGTLSGSDHHDNYKFQLFAGEKMTLAIAFDGNLPLVSVYLRDENGFLLDFMRDTRNTDLYAVGFSVIGKWYYLNITDDLLLGETYNVTFTTSTVSGFAADGNDDPTEAVDVAVFPYNINTTVDGDTEPEDHQDFYKVNLRRTQAKADLLVAHMNQSPNSRFWVEVLDNSLNNVEAFEKQDDSTKGANITYSYGAEAAGFYYVRVWAANGTGWYNLTLTVIEIILNDDNDKPENATALNIIGNHTAHLTGDVGEDLDLSDYYTLEVMEGQVINISITSDDYSPGTRLPKMHSMFLESDGTTPYDVDPNMTDEQFDPDGYTNASAPETGTNTNYIRIFVNNVASGGGAYTADIFTDRIPIVDDTLIHNISLNESTIDKPSIDSSIKLTMLFSDPDEVDALTYSYRIESLNGMDDTANFTVDIGTDADVTVTLSPRPGQLGDIGWKGSGEITFIATDPYGLEAMATFFVRVTGTNHAPLLMVPYNETHNFSSPLVLIYNESELNDTIDLNKIFTDIDGGDLLNFEVNGTSPDVEDKNYGYSSVQQRHYLKSLKINETFIIAFDLRSNLIDHKGTITVRLADSDKVKKAKADRQPLEEEVWLWAIDDGEPSKESDVVRLVLQATSPNGTAPKWSQAFNLISFNEDSSTVVDFDLYATDIDPQDQKGLTYSVHNTTNNITAEMIDRNHFKFTAIKDWSGTVKDVLLKCTDTFDLSKTHTLDVEVVSLPDGPVKVSSTPDESASLSINEAESQELHIEISDVDSDPDGDLEFNWSLDGTWLRTIVGDTYTYQASYSSAGVHNISVNVSERANPELFVVASWSITVSNVNRGPENVGLIEPLEGATYKVKTLVSLKAAQASDPDDDPLVYTWSIDGTVISNGRIFDTKDIKKGDHKITLMVSDGDLSVSESVNITIKSDVVDEPTFSMSMVLGLIIVMIIIVVIVGMALRSTKGRPVKDEGPDLYAADRAAMKDAMKEADEKEGDEEEKDEDSSEEE